VKYGFDYLPGSSYAHIVDLLDRRAPRGLVIDLGCGAAQIAAPLAALGFDYLGADVDPAAGAELAERGIEFHTIDLLRLDALADAVERAAGDRKVVAFTMLDVLEHLPDPASGLAAIAEAMQRVDAELLGLSVPNVAHTDLAAQLLMGRWPITETGLLDRTHLSLFTDQRLAGELASHGFAPVDRLDVVLPETEQNDPPDAPALAASTTLGAAVRAWRHGADRFGATYQFVGVWARGAAVAASHDDPDPVAPEPPFATVVVRTQGRRESLEDALTSLAAQTCDDFEVLLIVNRRPVDAGCGDGGDDPIANVTRLVAAFAPAFRDRVEVIECESATRSVPLNLALDRARGRYLTFLDDDDVVLAHWIETFTIGRQFPGRIVRSICYGQDFVHEPGRSALHYEPVAAPVSFGASFDYIEHLVQSTTPFCSIALPVNGLRAAGIRFDAELDVSEDYDVIIRATQLCGVIDTGVATSLYRRWRRQPGTESEITHAMWERSHDHVLDKLDAVPLLLPAGSARRVRKLEYDFHRLAGEVHALREYQADLLSHRDQLLHRVEAIERSRFWKLTRPLRGAVRVARRARRRVLRRHG
jgi:SAM-dependent methyltransferase